MKRLFRSQHYYKHLPLNRRLQDRPWRICHQ